MFKKYITIGLIVSSFSLAGNKGFEYSGVMVTTVTADKQQKSYVVRRNIPDECKKVPINNEMLWTENYASKKVPEACKSTFVHTTGKLLPMHLDEGLETYGELEVLAFLKEMQHNDRLLLIDSRKSKWFNYMTIPGAINMPFQYFKERDSYEFHFEYALKHLGVFVQKDGEYDFSNAKTLVLFCNGPWCSQSPSMIYALLEIGYPPEKLKWYRGGMQDWLGAGMTSTRK
ncbi:rhodanese-like domain-containing protein [Sulfurovum sp.]|uniref:rhodanese-like domain-containing protein n=1 Tax=Sulfurovum sp. TaxID=1969726 RepID=UPI0025FE1AE4|nr:rhodanese-like domain-containing protein [Sulfurovum sp.]